MTGGLHAEGVFLVVVLLVSISIRGIAEAAGPIRATDCENGGQYVQHANGQYYCDCTTVVGFSAFAGHLCEHASTQSCEYGKDSRISFCTNGGICKEVVFNAAIDGHKGCICPNDDVVGKHCEYKLNDEPHFDWMRPTTYKENTLGASLEAQEAAEKDKRLGKSGIIALVLSVCFGTLAVVFAAFWVYKRRMDTKVEVTMPEAVGDLEMDGSVLQEAVKQQRQAEGQDTGGLLSQSYSQDSKEGTWVGSPSTVATESSSGSPSRFRGSPISVAAGNLDPDGSSTMSASRQSPAPGSFAAATEPKATEDTPAQPSSSSQFQHRMASASPRRVGFADPPAQSTDNNPTAIVQDDGMPPRATATTPGRPPHATQPPLLQNATTPSRGLAPTNQAGLTPSRTTPSRMTPHGSGAPTPSRSHTPSRMGNGVPVHANRTTPSRGVPPSPGGGMPPPRNAVTPGRTSPSPARNMQTAPSPSGRTSPSPSRAGNVNMNVNTTMSEEGNPFEEGRTTTPSPTPITTTSTTAQKSYSPSSKMQNMRPATVTPTASTKENEFSNNPFLMADNERGMQQASLPHEADGQDGEDGLLI